MPVPHRFFHSFYLSCSFAILTYGKDAAFTVRPGARGVVVGTLLVTLMGVMYSTFLLIKYGAASGSIRACQVNCGLVSL